MGFYVPYPDPTRKPFPPCGLVSFIPTTNPATPTLNWIYIHDSRALLYGNRTASLPHVAGSWGWTDDEEGGGVTLDGVEGAVAVEMEEGWQLFWEDGNGGIQHGRRRFEVSVERVFIEDLASG